MSNKKLIIVIDDDPAILDSVQAILETHGYDVKTAISGEAGLNLVGSSKPDLVLCDMMMEHIDAGSRVATEIRKKNGTVPIYLLSSIGNETAQNIDIASLGFNGAFQKPIYPDSFIKDIKNAIER